MNTRILLVVGAAVAAFYAFQLSSAAAAGGSSSKQIPSTPDRPGSTPELPDGTFAAGPGPGRPGFQPYVSSVSVIYP